MPSPLAPWKGAPLRVLFAAEKPLEGELSLIAPDGKRRGQIARPAGRAAVFLVRRGGVAGRGDVARDARARRRAGRVRHDHARNRRERPQAAAACTRRREASGRCAIPGIAQRKTCIRHGSRSCSMRRSTRSCRGSRWDEVLRDRSRNFLFNYLGLGEDNLLKGLRPDCADFVYFLRAYFAFKMGLPFGYSNCSRGTGGAPPKCYQWFDVEHPEVTRPAPPPEQTRPTNHRPRRPRRPRPGAHAHPIPADIFPAGRACGAPTRARVGESAAPKKPLGLAASFARYLPDVGDVVHTGAVRVSANDDNTDFYTVPLTQATLRPGTVYADPYGHVLMLVQRVPESDGAPGVFLAVDAEPDGIGHAQAFLARQFPVRARSRARQPRLQALPADRAREERRLAAADQCRNRKKSAVRRFFARAVAAQRPRTFTIEWMT